MLASVFLLRLVYQASPRDPDVYLVPRARFELAWFYPLAPQASVSTSSTTWARSVGAGFSKPLRLVQDGYFRFGSGFAGCGALAAPPLAGCCAGGAAEGAAGPGA